MITKNIALFFLSIAIILVVAEVIARVVYVKPWYSRLIDKQVPKFHISKDELTLRNPYFSPLKPSNCKRVLILEDSFTYGFKLNDNSKIFPVILEKQLNAEFFHQREKIEIFNGGLTGSLISAIPNKQWNGKTQKISL